MPIKINYKKCCWQDGKCTSCGCGCNSTKESKACNGCVEVCPVNALVRKSKLEYKKELCINCLACISACKHGAISEI